MNKPICLMQVHIRLSGASTMADHVISDPGKLASATWATLTALMGTLATKGVISGDELNAVFALATASLHAAGNEPAAKLIEEAAPSSGGHGPKVP